MSHDLQQNAKFFDRLVDLVPAKYYHHSDQEVVNTKYLKKNAKAAAKQGMKEQYKQNKRAKLNPDTAKTSLQIQQEQAQRLQRSDDSDSDDEADDLIEVPQHKATQQESAHAKKPEPVKTLQLPAGVTPFFSLLLEIVSNSIVQVPSHWLYAIGVLSCRLLLIGLLTTTSYKE